jgi:site-specific recombinase XerD
MLTIADATSDYLESLAEKNRSQATSATYRYAIERFVRFLADSAEIDPGAPLDRLTQDHVRRFGIDLYRQRLAASSRSTYLVVLRNWFRYLARRPDLPDGSPVNPDLIELPKAVRTAPNPDERLAVMLTSLPSAPDQWRDVIRRRDLAMLETLFSTQLRVSELVALNRSSIDWAQGIAVVTGKGRKTRTVFFSSRALEAIDGYLSVREDSYVPLFIHHDRAHHAAPRDRDGETMRLTRQAVEGMVRKVARSAGIDATPHSFRHYGATELLRNGADIRTVQELLGHASVQTTQIYTHVSPRRLQQEWRRFHPAAAGPPGASAHPRDPETPDR